MIIGLNGKRRRNFPLTKESKIIKKRNASDRRKKKLKDRRKTEKRKGKKKRRKGRKNRTEKRQKRKDRKKEITLVLGERISFAFADRQEGRLAFSRSPITFALSFSFLFFIYFFYLLTAPNSQIFFKELEEFNL